MGAQSFGIDRAVAAQIAREMAEIRALGVELAIVIGGGNIFRGVKASAVGMDRAQFEGSGKPPQVIEKIVEGKVGSYYTQAVLLDQPSVRDQNITVGEMVSQAIAKTGENISIARFARFKLGESAEQA
jgi:translation elongation factor EF-Ts